MTTLSLLTSFQAFLHQQAISNMLFLPLCLIALDVATGILSALKTKTFDWKRLADFLGKDFFHYAIVVILVAIAFICVGQRLATDIATATGMTVLSASIFASIFQNIKEMSPEAAVVLTEVAPMVGLPSLQAQNQSTTLPVTAITTNPVVAPVVTETVQVSAASTPLAQV